MIFSGQQERPAEPAKLLPNNGEASRPNELSGVGFKMLPKAHMFWYKSRPSQTSEAKGSTDSISIKAQLHETSAAKEQRTADIQCDAMERKGLCLPFNMGFFVQNFILLHALETSKSFRLSLACIIDGCSHSAHVSMNWLNFSG